MRPTRAAWFLAGTAAGVYASVKTRRAAYRLSMPGLIDQAAALGTGWRAFSAEVRDGAAARETDLARQLGAAHQAAFAELPEPGPHDTTSPNQTERDPS